ncbi:unnamed protein product [Ixodes pacificus]
MGSPEEHGRFDKFIACICSHCVFPKPLHVMYRMARVKRKLHENGVDLDASCSAGPSTVCWLLDSLCPWNAILFQGGLGLYEEELGCLTCKTHPVPKNKELSGNEGAILEAAYLLFRLFGEHRCLQRLVVKKPYPLQDRSYWGALLKHALQVSKTLALVEVMSTLDVQGKFCVLDAVPMSDTLRDVRCSIHLSHEDSLSELLQPIGNVLSELVLGYPTSIPTTGYLLSNLGFCSSLKTLTLNVLEVDVGIFVDFMVMNKTITHLSISQVFPTALTMGDGVAYLLRVNTTLEVLQLRQRGGDATLLANSLCTNSTLRSLSLNGFENLALAAMAEMIILNDSLLELRLSARRLRVDVSEIAAAITLNSTLQHLYLRTSEINSTLHLVEALKRNSALLSLNVGAIHRSARDEKLFNMAVLSPWAVARVVASWHGELYPNLASALDTDEAPVSLDIWYSLEEHSWSFLALANVCKSLRANRSVKYLTLHVVPSYAVDESLCQALGAALRESKTLESVNLSFSDTENGSTMKLVCEGLKASSTIRCLSITVRASVSDVLKYMAAVFEDNRVITSLNLNVESLLNRRYLHSPLSALDEWTDGWTSLSKAIEGNRDLLEAYVSVKGRCVIRFVSDFTLTVQRNLSTLQQAVRFVLKPTMNKRGAEMFQQYEKSPELHRRLGKSEGTSQRGPYDLVLSATDFIAAMRPDQQDYDAAG